ncbi:MAG: ABC transporter permease [Nocardioides sp.]|uniref:ABC transporter permease n=1 Tax=Nocardioides sp. TaxID=35761 RepID=UPI0039E5FBAC
MSGQFAPAPGAAPLGRQVLAQAGMETRLMLRNGEQLLLAIVIPLIVLIGAVEGAVRLGIDVDHRPIDLFTPGVFALAVMSSSFTSLAIMTGFERRYGVLKRLGSSPLPRHGLLLGKTGALVAVLAVQLVVIGVVALVMGWQPEAGWLGALLAVVLGVAAFASLGLFVAGVLRAEATLAVTNLVYLLLLAAGGVVLPTSSYGGIGPLLALLPSGALGDALRSAFLDGTVAWGSLLVLVVWTVVGTLLTARTFRWE